MPYIDVLNINEPHLQEVLRVRREVMVSIPATKIAEGVETIQPNEKPTLSDWFDYIYKTLRK